MCLPSASRSVSLDLELGERLDPAAPPRDHAAAQAWVELETYRRIAHLHQRLGCRRQARAEAAQPEARN